MRIRVDDGVLMAGRQFRRGESVEVMHGAHAPVGGVGADAVLRVYYVVACRVERRSHYLDGAHDAGSDGFPGKVGKGTIRRSTRESTGRKKASSPPRVE